MILVLAATGARFSQVQRLRVVDLQIERQRLMMPTSKKGSGEKSSHVPTPVGGDVVEARNARSLAARDTSPCCCARDGDGSQGRGLAC